MEAFHGLRQAVFESDLPGISRMVMIVLIDHLPNVCPSVARIAERSGFGRTAVLAALRQLESAGWLSVDRRQGGRSSYQLVRHADRSATRTGTPDVPPPVRVADHTSPPGEPPPVRQADPKPSSEAIKEAIKGSHSARVRERELPERSPRSQLPVVQKVYSLPSEEPTKEYLDACEMGAVPERQARSTWAWYWRTGLPASGVERLTPWLVAQACSYATRQRGQRAPTVRQPSHGATGWPQDDRPELFGQKASAAE